MSKRKVAKPFEPNVDDRDSNLIMAAIKVEDAITHFESAMLSAENWADYETMTHFKVQLQEWLSSDHGEAGFNAYIS